MLVGFLAPFAPSLRVGPGWIEEGEEASENRQRGQEGQQATAGVWVESARLRASKCPASSQAVSVVSVTMSLARPAWRAT